MNKYQNIIESGMVRPLSELQAAVFDLDGTVYYGNDLIPGAKETISFFREKGLRVLFATNNSGRTRSSLTRKLNRLGIECVEDDVYNSGYVAVRFVEERGLKNIYVVGSAPFKEEMAQVSNMTDEEHADTLIVGIDLEFDYEEMTRAIRAAMRADTIIYCNQDMTYLRRGQGVPRKRCHDLSHNQLLRKGTGLCRRETVHTHVRTDLQEHGHTVRQDGHDR